MSLKRIAVLALCFSLFGMPVETKDFTEPASIVTVATVTDPAELLKELLENGKETPKIKKPVLAKGEHWVPKLVLDGVVDESSSKRLTEQLAQVASDGASIVVIEFNTPGGVVGDGVIISKAIENSSLHVVCVVDGMAASMGFYIMQSCDTRLMTDRSVMMAHEPAMTAEVEGHPVSWGNALARLKAMADAMAAHEAHRLKISLAEFHRRTDNGQDWWMTYQEASNVGAVDGVIVRVPQLIRELRHGEAITTI